VFILLAFKITKSQAKRVCLTPIIRVKNFPEDNLHELQDRLFEEFNSLSVLYEKPSEQWLLKNRVIRSKEANVEPLDVQVRECDTGRNGV
jgi:hypothetical protein